MKEKRGKVSRGQGAMLAGIAMMASAFCTEAVAGGSVRLDYGLRSMQHPVWEGMKIQDSSGISIDYTEPQWPVRLAVGIHQSDAEITRSEIVPGTVQCIAFFFCWGDTTERTVARSRLREVSLGVDKVWVSSSSRTRAYIGGGPALASASISNTEQGVRVGDNSAGLWAHAGFARADGPHDGDIQINWGFELRALTGTRLKLGDASANANYIQLGLLAGVSW